MPNVPLEDAQNCPCLQDCSCNAKGSYCCCDAGNPGNPKCGCTDPNANNYDPFADKDDCSCDNICHHYPGHPGCSGSGSINVMKSATRKAGLEGYANLIGPSMIIIDTLLEQ